MPKRSGEAALAGIIPLPVNSPEKGRRAESSLGRHTCLYDLHVALGARMVDFGGWDMPVAYGSQIEKHHGVRHAAGGFDVSHMCVIDLVGERTRALLSRLLANDIARLRVPGSALYSCMLNHQGGVIDDLIAYYVADDRFRLVVNAGTRDKDLAWIGARSLEFDVRLLERRDLAILAVQGPLARERTATLMSSEAGWTAMALPPFYSAQLGDWFVARTGYTGEDGFEIMLPAGEAGNLWQRINAGGVRSCGLGARDTLRLEAGVNLYGSDMDEHTSPLESGPGRSGNSSAGGPSRRYARAAASTSGSAWCWMSVRCCAATSALSSAASATARSPAAPTRRHCRARSAWRVCRARPETRCRSKYAAGCCRRSRCGRHSCVT